MKTIIILLLLTTSNLFGQIYLSDTLSGTNSVDLKTAWEKFSNDLFQKNEVSIKNEALKLTACDICLDLHEPTDDYYVPIDIFLQQTFRKLANTNFGTDLTSDRRTFTVKHFYNFHPKSLPNQKNPNLDIYQVTLTTKETAESKKGYLTQEYFFEFVQIDGEYKFYGFTAR